MPRMVLKLTMLCLLVFAGRDARAAEGEAAHGPKELKRAEGVLSKLKRLEDAARTHDVAALRKAASKVYPDIFASVSKLRDSDLKTDLSTAVALYDSALRDSDARPAIDCARELRDSYSRLCRGTAATDKVAGRARLLAAKARLHTRFAEALLLYARGARDAVTLKVLDAVRAERRTDLALAEEAVNSLKEFAESAFGSGELDETAAHKLEEAGRVLASLPRGRVYTLLRNARDASRDALYWRHKSPASSALVVDINSYSSPDRLRPLDTRADEASRAALANQRAALQFTRRAEEAIQALKPAR